MSSPSEKPIGLTELLVVVLSCEIVSFTESDSDYNDVQLMDPPQGSASNGISSTGSEPLAMNSSAAINDNFLNTQRQRHQDGCVCFDDKLVKGMSGCL